MKLNCESGDLAIVIDAWNPTNIGTIVRVIAAHPDQNAPWKEPGDFLWTVTAPQPMTYDCGQYGGSHWVLTSPQASNRCNPWRWTWTTCRSTQRRRREDEDANQRWRFPGSMKLAKKAPPLPN